MIRQLIEKLAEQYPDSNHRLTVEDFASWLSKNAAPAVERQEPWGYCPECGSEELHHEDGEHKQCADCHQEWFSDIDYSEVVRGNLAKLKTSPPVPVSVAFLERLLKRIEDDAIQIENEFGMCRSLEAIAAEDDDIKDLRACLDKVKEMNR